MLSVLSSWAPSPSLTLTTLIAGGHHAGELGPQVRNASIFNYENWAPTYCNRIWSL